MLIEDYKGFDIEIFEYSDGIESAITRIEDGWSLAYSIYASHVTLKEAIKDCKWTIEDYIKNPEDYEEDLEC